MFKFFKAKKDNSNNNSVNDNRMFKVCYTVAKSTGEGVRLTEIVDYYELKLMKADYMYIYINSIEEIEE